MALSEELVSEFAKITNDETNEVKDSVVYGTIAIINGAKYVQIDGADENTLTPVNSTVEVSDGDRVVVMLKNHQAVIQGNLTDNSAGMNGIDLKFDPENLIQQINLNASETKINGDNLDVDASTLDLTANQEFNLKLGSNQVIHAINNSTETGVDATIKASKLTVDASTLDLTANQAFNLKLGSNQVIHAINNSTETGADLKINANKINITGAVTFNSLDSDLASMFNSATAPSGAVTSSTINNMFTVNNGSPYYFNWGQTTRLTPTNIGVDSSIATTTLTAKYNGSFSFYYDFITEANWDKVTVSITHNGTTEYIPGLGGASGTKSGDKNVSISAGDIIRFEYEKDSSTHAANERVRFYDMYFSGVSSTVINGNRIETGTIALNKLVATPLVASDLGSSGSTVIDGNRIQSGTISAEYISTNISQVNSSLQIGGSYDSGSIDFYAGQDTIYHNTSGLHIDSTAGGIYMSCPYNISFSTTEGKLSLNAPSGSASNYIAFCSGGTEKALCGGSAFRPADNRGLDLGGSSTRWEHIYSYYSPSYSVASSSDRRVKKDIEYSLDKYDAFFDELKPVRYKYIEDNELSQEKFRIGLVAQDVGETINNIGLTNSDFAGYQKALKRDSEDIEENYEYFIDYKEFIGLLIDQVQKLKKRVDELETKLEGLA